LLAFGRQLRQTDGGLNRIWNRFGLHRAN
jgi:hypothetical protein